MNESFWDAQNVEFRTCANFVKNHFWGDPTIFAKNPLFSKRIGYPYRSEKIDLADSENRTTESKFRVFLHSSPGPRASDVPIFWRSANFGQNRKIVENCACPNLDAMSVPEALAHSIRILEAPAVYLKHRWLKS